MTFRRIIVLFIATIALVMTTTIVDNSISIYYPEVKRASEVVKCGAKFSPEDAFVSGDWWPGETWGRWTKDGLNNITFLTKNEKFSVVIVFQRVSPETILTVKEISRGKFKSSQEANSLRIDISEQKFTSVDSPLTITLETKNSVRPFDVDKENPDFRKLGIGVKEISLICGIV